MLTAKTRINLLFYILVIMLLSMASVPSSAKRFSGRVIGISDGDTITVLDATNVQHKIRVAGIDAPEKRQAFSEHSKQSMSRMAFDKQVQVKWNKKDRYGRIIGNIFVSQENCKKESCPKDLDVGLAQISFGLAWHYKKYEREQTIEDRQIYAQKEIEAQSKRVGLWSLANPIAPWNFRHNKQK